MLPDRRVLACDGQSLLDQVIGDERFDVVEHVEPVRKRGNGTDLLHPLALDRQCRLRSSLQEQHARLRTRPGDLDGCHSLLDEDGQQPVGLVEPTLEDIAVDQQRAGTDGEIHLSLLLESGAELLGQCPATIRVHAVDEGQGLTDLGPGGRARPAALLGRPGRRLEVPQGGVEHA